MEIKDNFLILDDAYSELSVALSATEIVLNKTGLQLRQKSHAQV
jgi:hypothetical protein